MREPVFSRPSTLAMLWYRSQIDQRHAELLTNTIEECMACKRLKRLSIALDDVQVRYLLTILIIYNAARMVESTQSIPRIHDPLPVMNFTETIFLFYLADKLKIEDLYDLLVQIIETWFWRARQIWPCEYAWVFSRGFKVANALRTRTNLPIPKAMAAHLVRKWGHGEDIPEKGRLMALASTNVKFLETLHEAWQFHIDLRLM